MALQVNDWELINQSLPSLYRELDHEKYLRAMLGVLNELVPSDSLAVNIASPRQPQRLAAVAHPENHATPEQVGLIGEYIHESPFAAYYLATFDSQWKMTTDFIPLEDFHQTNLHRLALAPLGINQQMFSVLGMLDGAGYGVVINRKDHGFSERDREVLNAVHPHLVTGFINAATHSRVKNNFNEIKSAMEVAPGAYGYFNAEGKVSWIQAKAVTWFHEFFPDEARTADGIPNSVQNLLIKSSLHGNAPQQLEKNVGQEILLVCLGADSSRGWVMRLERKPAKPLPHFHPLPQFTERKNQVLRWMLEGKRNAEIAVILQLSPRTVEKHVQAIIQEFQVENRATAIVRAIEFCAAMRQGLAARSPGVPGLP